jgi:hypothetical protein
LRMESCLPRIDMPRLGWAIVCTEYSYDIYGVYLPVPAVPLEYNPTVAVLTSLRG